MALIQRVCLALLYFVFIHLSPVAGGGRHNRLQRAWEGARIDVDWAAYLHRTRPRGRWPLPIEALIWFAVASALVILLIVVTVLCTSFQIHQGVLHATYRG